jgi:hypothetical protein
VHESRTHGSSEGQTGERIPREARQGRTPAAARQSRRAPEVCAPPPERERAPEQRQRDLVASLLRIAETQTRALEAREAPVPASELKAAVDVLERLQRLDRARPEAPPAAPPEHSLDEVRAEFARRLIALYGPGGPRERRDSAEGGIPIESWLKGADREADGTGSAQASDGVVRGDRMTQCPPVRYGNRLVE